MSQSVPFEHGGEDAARLGEDGPERRRRSDAALNRAKIIDAARALLADNRDASIREIADAAGLGRGTVHRHFSTREELINAVRRQTRDDADSDEEDYLRPPGELAHISTTPLSVADILNKVPPFQLGEQIIAEAQRLPGVSSAALYVVDLDGASMQRLAGAATFPAQISAPLAVGPEVPREGVAAIRAIFEELLPGATVAPLQLRSRAIGVLLAVGTASDQLRDLASEAAIALAIAPAYTDHIDTVRRTRPTSPAAEIQQNLLPPRIARVGGATLAGNVLPGYEIGGDWFDYTENPRGTWLGIADAAGAGAPAAGIGAVTLGAFRSVRRESDDPAESLLAMHRVLLEIADGEATSAATIGHWNAPASTFRWVTAGAQSPIRITSDGQLEPLDGELNPDLGAEDFPDRLTSNTIRLDKTERLLLLSDSFTHPDYGLGLPAIRRAIAKADDKAAPATLRAIEDALREAHPDHLDDDATIVVLAPSGMIGAAG
ncbi:MAG TPA: SpoIIE family protein phosphatase [Solirubrobacteraceae bacterium]